MRLFSRRPHFFFVFMHSYVRLWSYFCSFLFLKKIFNFLYFFILTVKETKNINIWSVLSLFQSFWFLPQDFASLPCPTLIFLVLFINLCFLCHSCPFLSLIYLFILYRKKLINILKVNVSKMFLKNLYMKKIIIILFNNFLYFPGKWYKKFSKIVYSQMA